MKKTLIALMALAGIAAAAQSKMTAAGNLYAGEFDLTFTIEEGAVVSGDYDILAAYYQVDGGNYTVNAFNLYSNGTLTMERGGLLSSTTLDNETTLGIINNTSTFTADGEAYTLGAGSYTVKYLGGTNGEAAANLYLGEELVASFTGGSHNMNGAQSGGLALTLTTNDSYNATPAAPAVPEPTTATLSLLALAGLAARRRRK